MFQIISKILFIAILSTGLTSFADKYDLDTTHAHIGFKIRHLGFSWVSGKFDKFSGSGEYDSKSGKIEAINIKIEASSINTNEVDRDKHLRSDDFFAVKKHKDITFKMTKVKYSGKKPTAIMGDFTMRGKTKNIKLKITDWGGTAVDPWGNHRIAFEAEGKIDRRKFGLTWNKGLKKVGGLTVGNEVRLLIQVEGIKKDEPKKAKK